jgi:hypothetical protein
MLCKAVSKGSKGQEFDTNRLLLLLLLPSVGYLQIAYWYLVRQQLVLPHDLLNLGINLSQGSHQSSHRLFCNNASWLFTVGMNHTDRVICILVFSATAACSAASPLEPSGIFSGRL